ncbi:MAG: HDOD domain-containing protein [Cellvibrionaceae bacterium]|nr:HDOD domain-containing protein [Cellvibrionaceae bacterium]
MELRTLINQATDLPKIPEVVQQLLESFNSADSNANEIGEQLSKDQALTAKVLRMANSTYFGGARSVGSVNEAVVFLGLNSLRTLVLASGISSSFKAPAHIDIQQFWRDSFAVAGICRWLCRFSDQQLDRELAFTCGMMHNVGTILVSILCPEESIEIEAAVEAGGERREIEMAKLGFTQLQAGSELAERWRFPTELGQALLHQQQPDNSEPYSAYAGILYLASYIYTLPEADKRDMWLAHFPTATAERLGLKLEALLDQVDEAVDDSLGDILS